MSAYEKFIDLQEKAAELVQADPYFAGIEVLTERKGDLTQKLNTALQTLGLSVVVMTPTFQITGQVKTRRVVRVSIVVDCSEIVVTNQGASGTRKPSLAAAWAAALALDTQPNGQAPEGMPHLAGMHEFALDQDKPVRLVPNKVLLTYQAYLSTEITV